MTSSPEAPALPGLPDPEVALRPLTRLENAFWLLERLSPDSGVSNIELAFEVRGPVRWWPLHIAANRLLHRHPALRLRYPEVDGVAVRHQTAPGDASVTVHNEAVGDDTLIERLQAFAREPFDLARDFPLRVGCFTGPGGRTVLCLVVHHITTDVASCRLLVEELCRIYDGVAASNEVPGDLLDEAPMFSLGEPSRRSMEYWLDRLTGIDPDGMRLAGARPRPARTKFEGRTLRRWLSAEARDGMRRLAGRLRVTENILVLSAFNLCLLRHGAGPDLVVGVPVGRRGPGERGQVGLGIGTMALRVRAEPHAGFDRLVRQTRDAFLAGLEHADASIEAVLTELGHRSAEWQVPVFRHLFNYRAWDVGHVSLAGEPVRFIGLDDRSRLDLELAVVPDPDGVLLRAVYATDVHEEGDVAAFLERLDVLLCRAAAEPSAPICELAALTEADRELIAGLNDTGRVWKGPATVPECVAANGRTSTTAPAVIDGPDRYSNGELLAWAEAVRTELHGRGIGRGDLVALALGRGAALTAAILGVWFAGASFVPLDERHPDSRLAFQVADADVALVVLPEGEKDRSWTSGRPVTGMPPPPSPGSGTGGSGGGQAPPGPSDPAYVMYTSGSTGRPKGVQVSHGNLANLVFDFADRLDATVDTSVLWSTTPAFDISMLELLLPLCTGGRLVVADDEAQLHPRRLLDLIVRHDVGVVQATPTAWRLITEEERGELAGRVVLCGGEPLDPALAAKLGSLGARALNVYGPTETTIWSTAAELPAPAAAGPTPVGRPIANTRVFVLDRHGQECPPGVEGELCVAGAGVSLGYLHRAELTGERFGEHPRWGRFYRTGDVARLRRDGTLDVLGRTDRQVKLRGHRIELGEIEEMLRTHPAVRGAVALIAGDPQGEDGRVTAFVRPAEGTGAPEPAELLEHLLDLLPHYFLPSDIRVLDEIPVTRNGKVDYQALARLPAEPAPPAAGTGESDTAPVSAAAGSAAETDAPLTTALLDLWRQMLGRPRLGPADDFFRSGGHSLLAVRAVPRIERLAGRDLSPRVVFDHPTARGLAAYLAALDRNPAR